MAIAVINLPRLLAGHSRSVFRLDFDRFALRLVTIMKRLTLITLLLLSLPAFASAGFVSGNDLREWGEAVARSETGDARLTDPQEVGQFEGYIQGVVDNSLGSLLCMPDGVKLGQLETMVIKFVESNPQFWDHSGDDLVIRALIVTFPCKPRQGNRGSSGPAR
ncbi:MAG TPA: Rap1a/Tai family immunity protein [Thiobacillaceae bacterium]|nr:Rap1a/Tai family immunity protein [Thiobacillaceae bacterium]